MTHVTQSRRLLMVDDYHAMAEAAIPEVWVVSISEDVVRVYRAPRGRSYMKGDTRQ